MEQLPRLICLGNANGTKAYQSEKVPFTNVSNRVGKKLKSSDDYDANLP